MFCFCLAVIVSVWHARTSEGKVMMLIFSLMVTLLHGIGVIGRCFNHLLYEAILIMCVCVQEREREKKEKVNLAIGCSIVF